MLPRINDLVGQGDQSKETEYPEKARALQQLHKQGPRVQTALKAVKAYKAQVRGWQALKYKGK